MSSSDDSVVMSIRELHRLETERQESEARRAAEAERERQARMDAEREAVSRAEALRLEAIEAEQHAEIERREAAERKAHEDRLTRELTLRAQSESEQRAREMARLEEHAAALAAIEARRNKGASGWKVLGVVAFVVSGALAGGYFGVYKPMARAHADRVAALESQAARARDESAEARRRADDLASQIATRGSSPAANAAAPTTQAPAVAAPSGHNPRRPPRAQTATSPSLDDALRGLDEGGSDDFGVVEGARSRRAR